MFVFINNFLRPSENYLQFFALDLKYGLSMPIVNLSVPLYVHPSHFLPLLKRTAYVQRAPAIALLVLQCHSTLFILFPDLWLTCLLCCLHILSTTLMLFAYGFLLMAYGVLCNKKKKSFPDQCTNDSSMHSPNQFVILKQCLHYSFSIKPCYV